MNSRISGLASALGAAGLLPMLGVLFVQAGDFDGGVRAGAVLIGHGYAALILSFLGGLWWGLGSAAGARAPGWLWVAAVMPSLIAFFPMVGMVLGVVDVRLALAVTGVALMAALLVDRALVRLGLTPPWWMELRVPLSLGLGGMSLMVAGLG
jgi:hypothetical protein